MLLTALYYYTAVC